MHITVTRLCFNIIIGRSIEGWSFLILQDFNNLLGLIASIFWPGRFIIISEIIFTIVRPKFSSRQSITVVTFSCGIALYTIQAIDWRINTITNSFTLLASFRTGLLYNYSFNTIVKFRNSKYSNLLMAKACQPIDFKTTLSLFVLLPPSSYLVLFCKGKEGNFLN